MIFSYYDYLLNNLLLPLAALVVMAVLVVRPVAMQGLGSVFQDRRLAALLVVLLAVAALLLLTLTQGGGLHLLTERPGDAVAAQGTIVELKQGNPLLNPRYSAYDELSSGYRMTLSTESGNVTVTIMARGTLAVGDRASVTYLPKSGFALGVSPEADW